MCEVHKAEMHPEWITISTGVSAYMLDYVHMAEKEFPHHGGSLLSGERHGLIQPLDRRVRDFVCDECTAAYRQYWKGKTSTHDDPGLGRRCGWTTWQNAR
jgi:hypothetical protein